MNQGKLAASFKMRIILSFSALILLFLGAMIVIEMAGIPGTGIEGKFSVYRAKTLNDMELVSGILSRLISNWFTERRRNVEALINSPLFRQAVESRTSQSPGELAGELNSFLNSHQGFGAVMLMDPLNASVIAACGESASIRSAAGIGIGSEMFSRIIIPGYQETIDIHHHDDNKPHFLIIRQVFSRQNPGTLIAILAAECDIENAFRLHIWSTGDLLSRDWECIIASKIGGIVMQFCESGPGANSPKEFIQKIDSFAPIGLAISGLDAPYDGPDQNGRPVLAFHRYVRIDRGIAMALILKTDRDLALKPAFTDLYHYCILWFCMLITGLILCIFLAKQISMPVNKLSEVARRVESGDLAARAASVDKSEIGQLAAVFNKMIARLQTWHQDLEMQIEKRTRDLQILSSRQNAVLTAVPDIIMEVDANNVYVWSNKTGYEFFGEDVIGKEAAFYFAGEQNVYETVKSLHQGAGEMIYVESLQRRKDGEIRLLAWRCKAFENERGEVTGILSTARDITEHKLAEEKIVQSLHEKETLIRELYHRTKNTMQTIRSMLTLQADEHPENAGLQAVVKSTELRIMAISIVHQMLYKTKDLSQISIKDYIHELTSLIIQSFSMSDRMTLNLKIDNQNFLLDEAIPLGLILNELITNSLKYAFPDNKKGTIIIELSQTESGGNLLHYCDNGTGVAEGFDFKKQSTLGMQLIFGIGESQMMGKVNMKCDNGVHCFFEFKNNLFKARV